jgi:hypothetical protein
MSTEVCISVLYTPAKEYNRPMKLPFVRKPDFWRTYTAITLTGLGVTLFAYVAVQQDMRLTANNAPRALAGEVAMELAGGADAATATGELKVDETASLNPFVTVVDASHKVVATTGSVGSQTPLPPMGAFDFTKTKGVDTFTWEHDGVRDAAVVLYVPTTSQYVVAAQSLRPVEDNIERITTLFLLTVIGVVLVPALFLLAI